MTHPVLIDLETRSACDLRERGGANYAADPTTRLLTVSWTADMGESYHVWVVGSSPVPAAFASMHLEGVSLHTGTTVPPALAALLCRPWAAHNAYSFDSLVWEAVTGTRPQRWIDTYPLALSIGLPGGLDAIGKRLTGEGKDEAGKTALKKAHTATGLGDCDPDNVPIVQRLLIAKYNVKDVALMVPLWQMLERQDKQPQTEHRVREADRIINARGVRLDDALIKALIELDLSCKDTAIASIRELTGGKLSSQADLQSRNKVLAWIDHMGLGRWPSLKKQVVDRWVAEHGGEEEEADTTEDDGAAVTGLDLPRVARVLELRQTALRVTGGKLAAALLATGDDGRARNLLVYYGTHTGRWAGRKVQPHNFPRPKPGVSEWALLDLYHKTGKLDYDAVASLCEPADAASALLRAMIVPLEPGHVIMSADLAQIEARVLLWLAGETDHLRVYWNGDDPYIRMAEKICGPKEKWPEEKDKHGNPVAPKKHSYRQLVGKVPLLACGYAGGEGAIAAYCADLGFRMEDYGLTPLDGVLAYRRAHPMVAGAEAGEYNGRPFFRGGLWDKYDEAARIAVETGDTVRVGPVAFSRESYCLIVTLPSGRRLTYQGAHIATREKFGKPRPCVRFTHPRYGKKDTYGGLFAENVTQAAARDPIASATVECEAAGIAVVLHVHDEVVVSAPPDRFEEFLSIVSTPPDWLTDFPLDCEGTYGLHYTKAAREKETMYRNGGFYK